MPWTGPKVDWGTTREDVADRAREYLTARSVCGERSRGDEILEEALAELAYVRDVLLRSWIGVSKLSVAEERKLDAMLKHEEPVN